MPIRLKLSLVYASDESHLKGNRDFNTFFKVYELIHYFNITHNNSQYSGPSFKESSFTYCIDQLSKKCQNPMTKSASETNPKLIEKEKNQFVEVLHDAKQVDLPL